MYISKTSRPIAIKLYQKHHCGGGLPVLGFEADKIRTAALEHLKKIPIDLQWERGCQHSSAFISDRIFFILAGNKDSHKTSDEFEIQQDSTMDCGVTCP